MKSNINYSIVAAAAQAMEERKEEVTVRSIREHIGDKGSFGTIGPLVKQYKLASEAREKSGLQLNPAISDLIIAQILEVANKAAEQSDARVKDVEQAFEQLSMAAAEVEAKIAIRDQDLADAHAQVLQQQGQLQERAREFDDLRASTTEAVAAAAGRERHEREQAESLRQELVRSKLRLEQLPGIELALEQANLLLSARVDELARANQAAAVALGHAEAQASRANESATRESKLEAQLQRLRDEREIALEAERQAQREILKLSNTVISLEVRCSALQDDVVRLRATLSNDAEKARAFRAAQRAPARPA